jgi:hypothetical protein
MASPDELLDQFIASWNAGERPRAEDYLERVPADARDELAGLVNAFLDQAPRPAFSAETRAAIEREPAVAELAALIDSDAGFWPSLLPRLRRRAQLTRDEVVAQLAGVLGVAGREPKVKLYYHQMESGTIDPEGVSGRVLESLAGIFGVSAEALERAGSFGTVSKAAGPATFYARSYDLHELSSADRHVASARASPGDWDEVDELFRGGR